MSFKIIAVVSRVRKKWHCKHVVLRSDALPKRRRYTFFFSPVSFSSKSLIVSWSPPFQISSNVQYIINQIVQTVTFVKTLIGFIRLYICNKVKHHKFFILLNDLRAIDSEFLKRNKYVAWKIVKILTECVFWGISGFHCN